MYRKIDLHIGPTLVQTKLTQHHVCDCKKPIISTEVKIGARYNVDLKSVRWVRFQCFGCGKITEIRVIDVWTPLLIPQWFPLQCLELDAAIALAPKPLQWEPVKENKVAPAHAIPTRHLC